MEKWLEVEELEVPEGLSGRADKVLSSMLNGVSRTWLEKSFAAEKITRDGKSLAKREKVFEGEILHFQLAASEESLLEPSEIPLEVLFEDEDVLLINKAPGMIVHPGSGTGTDTLVHALLHHCGESIANVGSVERPGIVHRLDKETSGVMVVAKSQEAYLGLVKQFSERSLHKEYQAIVAGRLKFPTGEWDGPIGRHPVHRKKMAIVPGGKDAHTDWEIEERISHVFTQVRCIIHTGRTHQIRVHFGDSGFPLAGDRTYGYNPKKFSGLNPPRILLHAAKLHIQHPISGQRLQQEAPLPRDFSDFKELASEQARREAEA
jgi:23S rRNA pseudouridine1911/1915/1917 synthase